VHYIFADVIFLMKQLGNIFRIGEKLPSEMKFQKRQMPNSKEVFLEFGI
jgi:hypothetical protein